MEYRVKSEQGVSLSEASLDARSSGCELNVNSGGFIKNSFSLVKLFLLTCFCCLFVNCCICSFDICLRAAVSVHRIRTVLCLLVVCCCLLLLLLSSPLLSLSLFLLPSLRDDLLACLFFCARKYTRTDAKSRR